MRTKVSIKVINKNKYNIDLYLMPFPKFGLSKLTIRLNYEPEYKAPRKRTFQTRRLCLCLVFNHSRIPFVLFVFRAVVLYDYNGRWQLDQIEIKRFSNQNPKIHKIFCFTFIGTSRMHCQVCVIVIAHRLIYALKKWSVKKSRNEACG